MDELMNTYGKWQYSSGLHNKQRSRLAGLWEFRRASNVLVGLAKTGENQQQQG